MRTSRILTLAMALAALAMIFNATGATAATRHDGDASSSPFAAQAVKEGLTSQQAEELQARADREVAATHGRQVALNKVAWKGGDTLLTLPGESRARDLNAVTTQGTVHGCAYKYFCLYTWRDYTGDIHRMYYCRSYPTLYYFSSYVNNQTAGTRARFYDINGNYQVSTMPAFYQGTTSYGTSTYSVRPC